MLKNCFALSFLFSVANLNYILLITSITILCINVSCIVVVIHWSPFNFLPCGLAIKILCINSGCVTWPTNVCRCFIVYSKFFLILFLYKLFRIFWASPEWTEWWRRWLFFGLLPLEKLLWAMDFFFGMIFILSIFSFPFGNIF